MPTLWAHEQYWDISSTAAPPPPPVGGPFGGYPGWQSSVIVMSSLFGGLQASYERLWALVALWRTVTRRIDRLSPDRRAVVMHTIDTLEDPAYVGAQQAVRATAVTLGFNRPEAWKTLSHALKRSPGDAENTFRHLNAATLLTATARAQGSTLSNPERHFLAELAYQDFALRGR